MMFEHRAFWLPKDLGVPDAYEDAYSLDTDNGRAAICDGVAAGIFSGAWARILAGSLAGNPPPANDPNAFAVWIAAGRAAWKSSVEQVELAWHQKAKLETGAAATALWIELLPELDHSGCSLSTYRIACRAVGDCCLLHFRAGQVLSAFPMDASSDYEQDPAALRSRPSKTVAEPEVLESVSECQAADLLVLTTDALAAWAIRSLEAGEAPDFDSMWHWSQGDWQRFIAQLRQDNAIRHDDTTLVLLRVLPFDSDVNRSSGAQALDRLKDSTAGRWLRRFTPGD